MGSPVQPADLNALPYIPDPVLASSHQPSLLHLSSDYTAAVISIRKQIPKPLRTPKLGIVCGSGLQGLAEVIQERIEVSYASIEGFGQSSVKGHQSALAFGFLGSSRTPVVLQLGRFHCYEGFDINQVVFPMRVMKLLGIEAVIITNAAGGLNPDNPVGTVIAVHDHISLPSMTSMNPLIGPNRDALGPRFPPMSDAYDFSLRCSAFRAALSMSPPLPLVEGTYAWVAGPSYETRAEQRFLRAAGADAVGMSTVPEVIAARHAGIRVLVLSLITNIVVATPYRSAYEFVKSGASLDTESVEEEVANHQEVLDVSAKRADDIRILVERIVDDIKL